MNGTNATLLEKVAFDTGFDRELPRQGDWLCFASPHTAMTLGLTTLGDELFLAAFSQHKVLKALADVGTLFTSPLPEGMPGARAVATLDALHQLVRRAFTLSRTLPDELLHQFEAVAAALPRATEAERLVVQRVGQDVFRKGLLEYWGGRCALTGLAVPVLLRASHIKPWADCRTDAERLDVFNGLLLAPHLDAVFDQGFITVLDDGTVSVSDSLTLQARQLLGLDAPARLVGLREQHRAYLRWHRERVFGQSTRASAPGIQEVIVQQTTDFEDPRVTIELLRTLRGAGLTDGHFRRLHHFGEGASMNVHEQYCAGTGRFRAGGENAELARRLECIRDGLPTSSLEELVERYAR